MHVEHHDWLNSMKATSSGHFDYLSAGRSRLATFLRDRTTEMVSISLSSSHLARHPCPSLGILAPLRHCPAGGQSAQHPHECGRFGCRPVLSPSSTRFFRPRFMVFLTTSYLGQDCKVGHAPVSFVVLLSVQLKPAY